MKLPFFTKKEKKEYFLALLLGEEKVSAVIFEEYKGTARIVGKHEKHLTEPLENTHFDTWLDVLDTAISIAENGLPENIQTQKTVFGVKESWVEDTKIKKEYLLKLKKTSDALMITPIGFIVIHEAIAHLLQQQEGAPVSAILVEIGKKMLSITLLRAGRIIETRQTEIKDDAAKTTDFLLRYFTNYEVLPSRVIVLSDHQNHEALTQNFISHTWTKSLPFLHVPQASILPKGFDAKAVFLGAASQMGFETLETHLPGESKHLEGETVAAEEIGEEEHGFGFVMGTDVREKKEEPEQEETDEEEVPRVSKVSKGDDEVQEVSNFVPVTTTASSPSFFHTILGIINPIKKTIMHVIKNNPFKKGGILLLAPAAVIVIIVILASYVLFLKATVTLSVKPKIVEKTQPITFITKGGTDFSNNTVKAEVIGVTEDGKITLPATGKKEIGTKAKGSVTIYNKTPQKVTLPADTVLTASNNLTFSLDDSVTIASASGASDAFSSISPSTAKGNVTAVDIGKESNLPSNTVFSIKSFESSDVAGKNDTAFSGGTKKEVTVVSKNDLAKAKDTLTKNLEEKAKNDMKQKTDSNTVLLPFITNAEFKKEKTSKKADEEADSFTLSGSIAYESLGYKKDDIKQFSENLLKQDLSDTAFVQEGITYTLQDTKEKKGEVASVLHAKISLLPKLDKEKTSLDIAGKSFDQATTLLKISQVSNVDISLYPNLFFLPKMLPRLSQNITLVLKKE